MVDLFLPVAVVVVTGMTMALTSGAVLARLPEPAEPDGKTAYRALATPTFVLACAGLAAVAQLVALTTLPRSVLPLWTVLATVGVLLAAIDARTTWLPLVLTRGGWALMVVALGLSLLLGLTLVDVARSAAGAAVAGLLYVLMWRATRGGFGFGDVRFAPLLGAATAGQSWTLLVWGLVLGSVTGAVHGAVRLVAGRRGGFPYAPSMLAGSYLAAVGLQLLLGRPTP